MSVARSKYKFIAVYALLPMLSSGCGLIYDYPSPCEPVKSELAVVADWRYAPDASPGSMVYSFFPTDGSEVWSFHFAGSVGGDIDLMYGKYSVLAYNDDTSRIMYDNDNDYSGFSFYCRGGGLYDGLGGTIDNPLGPSENLNGEAVEICPDALWCDHIACFTFGDIGVDVSRAVENGDPRVLTVYPQRITPAYHYVIEGIENLEGVARMCCSLSGMASMVRPSTMYRGCKSVTLPLGASRVSETSVEGRFFTFGLPECEVSNELTFYVWLSDGQKLAYRFDVSDQIRTAVDMMNVEICVGGISLPKADRPSTDGNTEVSVDGWITEYINIQS